MERIERVSETEFRVFSESAGEMVTVDLGSSKAAADEALQTGAGTRMLVPDHDAPPPGDDGALKRRRDRFTTACT